MLSNSLRLSNVWILHFRQVTQTSLQISEAQGSFPAESEAASVK